MKEMKKQLSLVLSLFMLLTCFVPASALAKDNKQVRRDEGTSLAEQPYEKDDFFISGVNFRGLTPKGKEKLKAKEGNLEFPDLNTEFGKPVSRVSQGGFKDLEIKSVKFSENIKEIDAQAFYNNSIENLNLPDSIKEIKWGAFQKNKISELKLSENYTDIYPSTFGDNQIKEVIIPDSVDTIRKNAFEKNPGDPDHDNKVVLYLSDVDKIDFYNDSKDTYFIKEKVSENYGAKDFTYTEKELGGVKTVEITGLSPEGKEKRKKNHILNIPSVIFGKKVDAIGKKAFIDESLNPATQFTSVILPEELTVIKNSAFAGNLINSVKLPNKLEVVEGNAFNYNALTEVLIPASVKEIKEFAFANNFITEGNAKIDNIKGKVEVHATAFNEQGEEGNKVDISPVYLKTAPKFNITLDAPEGVDVTFSPASPVEEGQRVTVNYTVTDNTKELLSIKVKKSEYSEVTMTGNTFIMPKADVKVVVLLKDKYTNDKWHPEDFIFFRYEEGDPFSGDPDEYINEMTVKGFSDKGLEKLKTKKDVVLPVTDTNGVKVECVYENSFINKGIKKLTVPANYKKIYDNAFKDNEISELVLNEGLIYIFENTFANNKLTEFIAPDTFKYPSKGAFKGNKLKKVVMKGDLVGIGPESFMNNEINSLELGPKLDRIYDKAFVNNKLTEVNIPLSLKKGGVGSLPPIYKTAFNDNPGTTNPAKKDEKKVLLWTPQKNNPNGLPDGENYVVDPKEEPAVTSDWETEDFTYGELEVTQTGSNENVKLKAVTGFSDKGKEKVKNIKDLVLPTLNDKGEKLEAVAHGAFKGDLGVKRLDSLKIPEGYLAIGSMAFAFNRCGGDLVLPSSLESVGMAAFFRNEFVSLTVPEKMTEIPLSMMRGNKLKNITFKGNIEKIGGLAFAENRLEEVNIPDSLKEIGKQAFTTNTGNPNFNDKVVLRTKKNNNPQNLPDAENYLVDPAGEGDPGSIDYTQWFKKDFTYSGQKVTGFSGDGERKIKRNKNLVIPDETPDGKPLLVVGIDAFRNLNAGYDIETVKIPDTVVEIEDYAFQFNEIAEVTLPRDLKTLGMGVFMMSNVNKVIFNEKLEYIDQACFFDSDLGEVKLPATVNTIMNAAFRKAGITKLTFAPNSKLKIIENLGLADNKLTTIDLPKGIEKIGNQAFGNNKAGQGNKFTEINVPASLKSIGFQAFLNNPGVPKYNAVVIHTPEGKNPAGLLDDTGKTFVIDPENTATPEEKQNLKEAIEAAEKVDVNKLTTTFKDFFTGVLQEAKDIYADDTATQSKVNGITKDLKWATKRAALNTLMFEKEALNSQSADFDKEKWNAVEEAYKSASKYLMIINISETKVDKLINDLMVTLGDLKSGGPLEGATAYEGMASIHKTHYIEPYDVKVKVWVKNGKIVYVRDNGTVCDDPNEDEEHNRGYFESAVTILYMYIDKKVEDVKKQDLGNELGIDAVSGATVSCNALHSAVKDALKKVGNTPSPGPGPGPSPDGPAPGPGPDTDPTPLPEPSPSPKPDKKPLILKEGKKNIIKLKKQAIEDLASGKCTYLEMVVKNVSLKIMSDGIEQLFKNKKNKNYFKVLRVKKNKLKMRKAEKKKIYGKYVYKLKLVIAGSKAPALKGSNFTVGIPYKGKVKGYKFFVKNLNSNNMLKAKYNTETKRVEFKTNKLDSYGLLPKKIKK